MNLSSIVNKSVKGFKLWKDYPIIFSDRHSNAIRDDRNTYSSDYSTYTFRGRVNRAYGPNELKLIGIEIAEGLTYGGIAYISLPEEGLLHYLQHPALFLLGAVSTVVLRNIQSLTHSLREYENRRNR